MSLAINPNHITSVLLADGWHPVKGNSFDIDAYEYVLPHPNPDRNPTVLLGGGQCAQVPSAGFTFTQPDGSYLYGPLTSILAVTNQATQPHA